MKKIFVFIVLCCLVSATFAQTKAKAVKTSAPNDTTSYNSFKDAVDFLNNNGGGTVFVCADDSSTGAIYIKEKITILPYHGGTYTITRAASYHRSLFSIEANSAAELILGNENPTDAGTLIISGNNVTNNPTTLFYIKNKTTFRNGVILQDNYASDVNDSNMSGAITIDANGSDGNGTFKGELHITGNTIIQSNHITYNAPIIRVSLNGKFYMENGTIKTNDATLGTIIGGQGNNSIIEITGGTIQNNAYKHDVNNAAIKTAANNYALGGSVSIQDTIMGDKQIKVLSNLTNHNANNPILVKVNYTGERQLLIGDSATVANNFLKFKPIDVNGNPVCISMDGKLINATYIVYIDGSSTPNSFYTLAQVTDFINSNASTSALIDIQGDDNMNHNPFISKNISVTIQAINGKHTIRKVSQHSSNLLYTTQSATITFRSKTSTDTLILDGTGLEASILYFSENSNASLQGNVFIENYNYDEPVISVDNSTLKVNSGTTFRNNTGDYGIIGGFDNSNVIIDGGVFTNNSFNKPLVYSVDYDSLRITGGTFSNNSTPTGSQFGAIGGICETSCSNDNRFYSIGGSVSITDTIASNSCQIDSGTVQAPLKIKVLSNLTNHNANNPIVVKVNYTGERQLLTADNATLIADNYMKFKPAADTLTINQKGWVVRKPQISINGIYMLQAMTKFSDYGITTANPDSIVGNDMIYVAYTQKVDAHGQTNTTRSDSTILEMNVTYGGATSHIRQNIAGQENGSYNYTIPFNSSLWDVQPSAGALDSGRYQVEIDTLIVHTLGVSAGTESSLDKNVNIPHITIDTLNFLLAGTRFSDYHYCSVGATTNDGDGADVVPGDEIYVEYTRTGAIDTAYVMVAVKGNGQNVVYREGTPAGTHFGVGCGSFRTFLDNTGIGQFVESSNLSTPATLALEDDSTYRCLAVIRVKADGEPYFSVGTKSFNYTHNIDREVVYALDTFSGRNVNYNNIGITLTRTGDSLALNYPSAFSVAKAREYGMVGTDNRIYVVITADPEDTTIRVAPTSPAMLLADNNTLDATNYTNISGTQGGKFLKAVCVSEEIQTGNVVVSALNFDSGESELTWTCAIGENTGVHNPYNTYRTFYKLTGNTAHDTTKVAHNQMSYRNTGVSGVKLHASSGQASYMFHPEDYTVWPTQDPTPGLDLNNKVWLALYVSAPNANVKKVYNPALNTPFSTNADSVVTLQDAPAKRVTATEAVNYYPVGTCADYATKDYTFYHTGDAPYLNNYLYWFDENEKLLSVQKYNVSVKRAPTYTVNYNFNGGGAHCNTAYPANYGDTTYIFGRKITRPADPYKCGNLFMDWYEGNNQFLTVDSFQNVRSGEAFGIRANHNLDAHWQYFVTLSNPHDTAVIADYSLCDINTRSYVWEPTETTFPYVYTFHTDYLGHYYRDYAENTTNCNVRFDANAFTENPVTLPVGQTSQVTWTYTDMCNTTFTISQNVNVKFPPCGADNYNPHLYPFTPYVDSTYKAMDANGNLYETARMGCDCWTKENLKTLNYAQDNSEVAIAKAYLNNEANVDIYGRLYTWYSAVKLPEGSTETTIPVNADNMPQGVCPNGWYLPSEQDFARMSNLGNINGASAPIKEEGVNDYWLGNETGTNATSFTALPAGFYNSATNRYFNLIGDAYFWTSSSTSTINAPCCALTHSCPVILITNNNKGYGYSVRCIKYKKFDY